jgi:putative transposase
MPAAATQAAAPARSPAGRHIAAIHALKAKAGLSDEDYRALLLALTGQNSSKLLTEAQQQQVRKHLQTLADKMRPTTARAKGWVPQAQAHPTKRRGECRQIRRIGGPDEVELPHEGGQIERLAPVISVPAFERAALARSVRGIRRGPLLNASLTQGECREFRVLPGHDGKEGAPPMPRRKAPHIPDVMLDQLLSGTKASAAFDQGGLLDQLKKALAERALNAEMDHHLAGDGGTGNSRNGYGRKNVATDTGRMALEVPRDRQGSFEPLLIAKYQRRFPGFDDKIISMYARGMSTREIAGHLLDLYGVEVSADLISTVTDAVLDEIATWQARPLEPVYPLVFFDALRVKIRDEGLVRNKAVHIALGVRADGTKEVLGLWLEQNEGAKFWLRVMNELRNRGVEDVLLAVVDGLKGFPEAILAVFPEAVVQTCIVHLLRHSLDFVSWKDRKPVAAALKDIYRAIDPAAAEAALAAFEAGPWGRKYAAIGQSWRRAWGEVIPFYAFPLEVRRLLYTTNSIEALNAKLRRAVRARGHFPTDEAALKLLFLVLHRSEKEWTMPPREWSLAKAQFAVLFGERFTRAMA